MTTMLGADPRLHGFRHEAMLYADFDEFLAGTVRFVRDAAAADDPVLVVLRAPKIAALRAETADVVGDVRYADMGAVGANPARIIPAWREFVSDPAIAGRRLRGIGEPISASRTADELVECERHEALLNLAFADASLWLLCPYDTTALPSDVIDEARRSHPYVHQRGVSRQSARFPGTEPLVEAFDDPLSTPPLGAELMVFDRVLLPDLRRRVKDFARHSGLSVDRVADLVFAVNEVATNSVRHGGGTGTLIMWERAGTVVCEVRDGGAITDPLVGRTRPAVDAVGRRGAWLVNQLCDLVQVRTSPDGNVVRLHLRRI
jgi:anti-sigma regulatory factor (Ser/Thr protein kinase)